MNLHLLSILLWSYTLLWASPVLALDNESRLEVLDRIIEHKSDYQQLRSEQIKSLSLQLCDSLPAARRLEIYDQMIEAYRAYNLDSQRIYVRKRFELASAVHSPFHMQAAMLNMGEMKMRENMYHESILYLDSVQQQGVREDLLPYYYHLRRTLYGLMEDFATYEEEIQAYCAKTQLYRDSLLTIFEKGTFYYTIVSADKLRAEGAYKAALNELEEYGASHRIDGHDSAAYAITYAQIYHETGEYDEEEHWLIEASIADIQQAVREYIALQDLAILLKEKGDIERAYRYMLCVLDDAKEGDARVRSVEAGMLYPVIAAAYRQQLQSRQRTLVLLVITIAMIVIQMLIVLIYIIRQHRLTARLNATLETANRNLQRSNQIKTVYIGRYMETTSLLIDRFDQWRKQLRADAEHGARDKVYAALCSQDFTQEQLSAFYHDFDTTFLELFPDFIEKVQDLLVPEATIRLKDGECLNTDLRVLALIRLGITDSRQIADFLRYSPSTIFNCRTRMRNLAKGDRNEFEEKIRLL